MPQKRYRFYWSLQNFMDKTVERYKVYKDLQSDCQSSTRFTASCGHLGNFTASTAITVSYM